MNPTYLGMLAGEPVNGGNVSFEAAISASLTTPGFDDTILTGIDANLTADLTSLDPLLSFPVSAPLTAELTTSLSGDIWIPVEASNNAVLSTSASLGLLRNASSTAGSFLTSSISQLGTNFSVDAGLTSALTVDPIVDTKIVEVDASPTAELRTPNKLVLQSQLDSTTLNGVLSISADAKTTKGLTIDPLEASLTESADLTVTYYPQSSSSSALSLDPVVISSISEVSAALNSELSSAALVTYSVDLGVNNYSMALTSAPAQLATLLFADLMEAELTSDATAKFDLALRSNLNARLIPDSSCTKTSKYLLTSKDFLYPVSEPFQTHLEMANDNLVMQFKDCPNILSVLNISVDQLDIMTQDILDIQSQLFNLEESTGFMLDILGRIMGLGRESGLSDTDYRKKLLNRAFILNNDGTMSRILTILLNNYDYPMDDTSRHNLVLETRSHNSMEVYVRSLDDFVDGGGAAFVDALIPAGAKAIIKVNQDSTPEAGFFTLENDDGAVGVGLGSEDVAESGGELVGTISRDPNTLIDPAFGLEDDPFASGLDTGGLTSSVTRFEFAYPGRILGNELPTTTSEAPVRTFGYDNALGDSSQESDVEIEETILEEEEA